MKAGGVLVLLIAIGLCAVAWQYWQQYKAQQAAKRVWRVQGEHELFTA
jgi:predicted negative regulator of RcsB-dependent stress response